MPGVLIYLFSGEMNPILLIAFNTIKPRMLPEMLLTEIYRIYESRVRKFAIIPAWTAIGPTRMALSNAPINPVPIHSVNAA